MNVSKSVEVNNRKVWIDISKGIAIILVIIGHVFEYRENGTLSFLTKWIYSFHMPLFFLLAGYTFNINKYTFKNLVKLKSKTLFFPYLTYGFMAYLVFVSGYIANVIFNINMLEFQQIGLVKPILGLMYGKVYRGYLPFVMQPLWFLVCIYFLYLSYYLFNIIIKNKYALLFVSIICSWFFYKFNITYLPFSLDSMFMVLPFFVLGIILNKINIIEKLNKKRKLTLIILSISLVISIISSQCNDFVVIALNSYGNYFLYNISCLAGMIFIITASILIERGKILPWFGINSLIILITHMILIFLLKGLTIFIFKIGYEQMIDYPIILLGISLITILIEIPIIYVINTYFAFSIGKYKGVKYEK